MASSLESPIHTMVAMFQSTMVNPSTTFHDRTWQLSNNSGHGFVLENDGNGHL